MLVFYSLIIKRQSVLSVKLLLSVSFALLMIFVFAPTKFCSFFFEKNTVVTIMVEVCADCPRRQGRRKISLLLLYL